MGGYAEADECESEVVGRLEWTVAELLFLLGS